MAKNGSKPSGGSFKINPATKMGRGAGNAVLGRVPSELDSLHLKTFEDDGETPAIPGSRLQDVAAAIGCYVQLRRADEGSALVRARHDAMFDGAPPFDQAKLIASGQSQKTNVNFGQGARILNIALSSYVDLYASLETFMEVKSKYPDTDDETFAKEQIVAEKLTEAQRNWPDFHSRYLRLCSTFTKHGVGVLYFDNPQTFKFQVGGLDDMLIPRQTPASEEYISVAVSRRDYQVDELFGFIKNPKAAKARGWDVDEVIRLLNQNVSTVGASRTSTSGFTFESWQATLKNNDVFIGIENPAISILHFWVKETDGSISHKMCAEHNPQSFCYQKEKRFSHPTKAYIFFTNGVGTNGTYHSVRGLGHMIGSHVQILNKMRCHGIDGSMMGAAVMIQPLNQRGIDELEFSYYGAYAVLSPDAKIVEKAMPNMDQVLTPMMNDITDQLLQNTDTVTTYGPDRGSPYRNQMQVASDLEVTSRISGSSINLFYQAWSKAQREITRRIIEGDRKDPIVKKFYEDCLFAGVDEEFIKNLDLERTEATRSVGDGSAANRMLVQKELAAMAGQFDEIGQKNLVHDQVATLVGHKMANRYAPAPSKTNGTDRDSIDTKIALLENLKLEDGTEIPPLSSEMHGKHLRVHIPLAQNILTGIEEGHIDPVETLPIMGAIYFHLSDTAKMASSNPNLEPVVNETRQILQLLEEQLNNAQKAKAKMERDAMEAQAAEAEMAEMAAMEGQGGGPAPEGAAGEISPTDMKLAEAARAHDAKVQASELDMEITRRKADLDMAIRREDHEQKQALEDAKVAAKIRNEVALREAKTGSGTGAIGQ
jgi:hypothetical protein